MQKTFKVSLVLILVALVVSVLTAGTKIGDIGPAFSDGQTVTIPKPGNGNRNCISDVIFSSTSSTTGLTTFRMLTDQTTTFMVVITTTTPPVVDPFTDAWCGDYGSTVTIKSDGRGYQIYYKGFIERVN